MCSCWDEIAKQEGFVRSLVNYTNAQWLEFFRMSPSTAQCLVETIGPVFRERSGVYEQMKNAGEILCPLSLTVRMTVSLAGRGRPSVHLQEQVLMLLHFTAHQGKYGLLSEKFGITQSCYHGCVDSLMDICVESLLHVYTVAFC